MKRYSVTLLGAAGEPGKFIRAVVTGDNVALRGGNGEPIIFMKKGTELDVYPAILSRSQLTAAGWKNDVINLCPEGWHLVKLEYRIGAVCSRYLRYIDYKDEVPKPKPGGEKPPAEDKPKDETSTPTQPSQPSIPAVPAPSQNWMVWVGIAILAAVGIGAVILTRSKPKEVGR
ncbi:MAG: hypothetical protein ACP5QG_09265 [candidate division WOR-3 bacterium]